MYFVFFFNDTATTEIYTLSLHDALPICDLLAFNSPVSHIGIYIGGGKMIEAPRTGLDVRIIDVYETPTAVRRILPSDGAAGTASSAGAAAMTSTAPLRPGTPYADLFRRAEAQYGISARLLASVAQQES